eukprot:951064-Prymnesium_polylepis.1
MMNSCVSVRIDFHFFRLKGGFGIAAQSHLGLFWSQKSFFSRRATHADRCLAPVLSAVHSVISPPCTDSLASAQTVSPGCAARAARGSARCVS